MIFQNSTHLIFSQGIILELILPSDSIFLFHSIVHFLIRITATIIVMASDKIKLIKEVGSVGKIGMS